MTELHVLFRVGDADYAVPASRVRVMESFEGATRVPGTPSWVKGLVQIRGEVVPVVDLRARFGLPSVPHGLDHRVVVVEDGDRRVGLLVDSAREVVPIARETFRDPPEAVAIGADRFVKAVAHAGDRLLMLIDERRVIGDEDIHVEQRT